MISKELLSRVKKLEIRTRRLVDEVTAGAYHSVFKGSGIEFDEVREYTSDDDIRDIDWNVTARMGIPYIKKYVEERELTVMLVVDISASGLFGSENNNKNETAIEIASLIIFSAIRNNDKVGLLLFTDQTEYYLPPRSGRLHGLRLIRELLAREPQRRGTDIRSALESVMRILHKKTVIFFISDFIDEKNYERLLKVASKRHDLIGVRVLDKKELALPDKTGFLVVEDFETGNSSFISGNKMILNQYSEELHRKNKDICTRAKVDLIDISPGDDLVLPLMAFFKQRKKIFNR